jgi:hypothetical protein
MMWHALCIGDVFIVDEDLGHSELWDRGHATLLLLVHGATESTSPVQSVEEANNNVPAHSLFNALKTCATTKKFLKPVEMLVQCRNVEDRGRAYLKLLLSLMTL